MRARMPAHAAAPDRILAGLTARQLLTLGVTFVAVGGLYSLLRSRLPFPVTGVLCLPLIAVGLAASVGRLDGLGLDRIARLAVAYLARPKRRVLSPGEIPDRPSWAGTRSKLVPVDFPVETISYDALIDLGKHGFVSICRASAVNLSLRSDREQSALVEGFGKFLNSLDRPVQFLVRSGRVDLSDKANELMQAIPSLPHPLLEEHARHHAEYLGSLAARGDIHRREAFLCFREQVRDRHEARARLSARLEEAVSLLRGIGVRITPVGQAEARLLIDDGCGRNRMNPVEEVHR